MHCEAQLLPKDAVVWIPNHSYKTHLFYEMKSYCLQFYQHNHMFLMVLMQWLRKHLYRHIHCIENQLHKVSYQICAYSIYSCVSNDYCATVLIFFAVTTYLCKVNEGDWLSVTNLSSRKKEQLANVVTKCLSYRQGKSEEA